MPLDQENTFQENKTTWKKLRNGNIGLTRDDLILQVNRTTILSELHACDLVFQL